MHPEDKEYEARREAEHRAQRESFKAHRASLLVELQRAGVEKVVVEFDGAGGDGSIDLLECVPAPEDKQLVKRTDSFVEDMLVAFYPGYDEEEGAFGNILWDLATDTLIVDFRKRVRAYRWKKIQHGYDDWRLLESSDQLFVEES